MKTDTPLWTLSSAQELCIRLEELAIPRGLHVALGGSCLIHGESFKDVDIFFYPHKSAHTPEVKVVHEVLTEAGLVLQSQFNPVYGAEDTKFDSHWVDNDKRVDVFYVTAL